MKQALAQLGAALLHLRRLDDSVDHSRRAASIFDELANPDDAPGEAMALTNLASVLERLNRTEECIDPYQRHGARPATPSTNAKCYASSGSP